MFSRSGSSAEDCKSSASKAGLFSISRQDTYYIVGNPISYIEAKGIMSDGYRDRVPESEILEAYPKEGTVKLFMRYDDAWEYARSLREERHYRGGYLFEFQPAVYTVSCSTPLAASEKKTMDIVVNPGAGKKMFMNTRTGVIAVSYNDSERSSKANYFDLDITQVQPVAADYKVHLFNQGQILNFTPTPISMEVGALAAAGGLGLSC